MVFAFILGVPYVWSPVAYFAVTSIAVIGLYIAYIIPIFLRLKAKAICGRALEPGPQDVRHRLVAVVWVIFICILFMLPTVTDQGGHVQLRHRGGRGRVLFAGLWWLISARNWFKGPKVQGTSEELAAIEAELVAV